MIRLPNTLSTEVLEGFNALIHESDQFRDWYSPEIQELVRALDKLQKSDAREAFVLLGSLAAICGDVDGLFQYYEKALRLPDQITTKREFWSSLANAGLYQKAQHLGHWLLDPKRGFFPAIWKQAASIGLILEVRNGLAQATKTYPELTKLDFSSIDNAARAMDDRGVSDEEIGGVLDLMGNIQRKHRIMFSGQFVTKVNVMRPPEDPPYLYITLSLSTGVDKIHTMNRELAAAISAEGLLEGAFPQGVVASFAKASEAELRAAA